MVVNDVSREISATGAYQRQSNAFETPFGDGPDELPVEAGRYRLLAVGSCPWAHRQLVALNVLGLTDAVSIGMADVPRTPNGWRFSLDKDNRDPVLGYEYVTDAYLAADPNYDKRATVPAVVDVTTGKVVNNDYHRLTNYWEVEWAALHKPGAPDLYPVELRDEIDELNAWLFEKVNDGVYKCGFAVNQESYEAAYDSLFAALDDLEERLATRRFLFGDYVTDSDIRLYVTLARFDAAYYAKFRANRQRIVDFENLWGYARDLYEIDGFGSTTNFDVIKGGYFRLTASSVLKPDTIIPKGPDETAWLKPHDRAKLSATPDQKFRPHTQGNS